MARGPKKHLKRMFAPSHWMLDKLTGVWAPKPSAGPHKQRECMPLIVILRNSLKYALTFAEAKAICFNRLVKVDGKVRTEHTFPAGLMDILELEKTKEFFRMLLDTKGRFNIHKISKDEAHYKLCRVKKVAKGAKNVGYIVTHDGRTIRFPHPDIAVNDTVRFNLETNEVEDFAKFEHGNVCMLTGGNNIGRVGVIQHREKHPGAFDIVYLKDKKDHGFATRIQNVMVIGKGNKPWISLPKGDGIKLNIIEDRQKRMKK